MDAIDVIHTDRAPTPIGPYSQAVIVGRLLFCSGQIPLDSETGSMVSGDIASETRRVLDNLEAVLLGAGASLDRVVKATIYLTNLGDITVVNETYQAKFGEHRPARVTVEVAGLPGGARVEIDAVAVL